MYLIFERRIFKIVEFLVHGLLVTNIVLLKVTILDMDKIPSFRIPDHLQTNLILYSHLHNGF